MTDEYARCLKMASRERIRIARTFAGAIRGGGKHVSYIGALAMTDNQAYYVYRFDDESTADQKTGIIPHILVDMDSSDPRWATNEECLDIMMGECPRVFVD